MLRSRIKIDFKVDDDYLIIHTLRNTGSDQFSSDKYKKDLIAFQDYAWDLNKNCYNFLIGRSSAKDIAGKNLQKILKKLPEFIEKIKSSKKYQKIRTQTKKYRDFCESEWGKNYPATVKIVEDLIGLKFDNSFTVYITHPSQKNGIYLGDNIIEWGHNEDWPNYTVVYLWHEILHAYFGFSDEEHAVIELIIDNELRIKLNGGKYPPFKGHRDLNNIKKTLLPFWMRYLKSKEKNINKFIKQILRK